MQAHDFQFGAQVDFIVEPGRQPVLRRLPVLAHHDHRRLDRREHREHQVEEDIGIGIEDEPRTREDARIEQHPRDEHDAEGDDETPRTADRRHPVGQPVAEARFLIVNLASVAAGRCAFGDGADDALFLFVEFVERAPEQAQRHVRDPGFVIHDGQPIQRQMPAAI